MGEPGGELFHFAGGVVAALVAGALGFAGFVLRGGGGVEQHLEVGADDAVAVEFGRLVVAAERGVLRDLAEDPGVGRGGAMSMIVASEPPATMATASSGVRMSPLPTTGIETAFLTAAICSQRAWPE